MMLPHQAGKGDYEIEIDNFVFFLHDAGQRSNLRIMASIHWAVLEIKF